MQIGDINRFLNECLSEFDIPKEKIQNLKPGHCRGWQG